MSGRMTDERLANLQKWLGAEHGDHPVTLELLQALTAERKWVRTGPTANMLRVEELEATLARVRGLPGKWMKSAGANHAETHILSDRGFMTIIECADELEAALQSDAGAGSNQPEVDNPKSEG